MPATTATKYPYPLGTDRLMDGDDAIHSLAAAIPQFASGTFSATTPVADQNQSVAVSFPVAFAAVPMVVVGMGNAPPSANYNQAVWLSGTPTVTGFTMSYRRQTLNPTVATWIAHGAGAA